MNRPRILLAAAVALAVALTGCTATDGGDEKPPVEIPDTLGGTIIVFAAASLTEVFGELKTAFEEKHPNANVVLSFGGSGALATQIIEGAAADVFAAASGASMITVLDAGDAEGAGIFTTNTLEIAVPPGNPAGITGLADLANPDLTIVLCDPSVPCGASAETLVHQAGYQPAPDSLEEDVKAVLTKIELGEADAGLVYVTDVVAAGDKVEGIEVPGAADVVNEYPIAVIDGARNPDGAQAWVEFVFSAEGQAALAAAGFVAP